MDEILPHTPTPQADVLSPERDFILEAFFGCRVSLNTRTAFALDTDETLPR